MPSEKLYRYPNIQTRKNEPVHSNVINTKTIMNIILENYINHTNQKCLPHFTIVILNQSHIGTKMCNTILDPKMGSYIDPYGTPSGLYEPQG